MAQTQATSVVTEQELLQAQAELWRHSLCYLKSMALQCAIQLGIPAAIHHRGSAGASLPDIHAALSLPAARLPFLRRLMRLLTTSGVFAEDVTSGVYTLTPVSRLLVDDAIVDGHTSLSMFALAASARLNVDAALALADWFKDAEAAAKGTSPFEMVYGVGLFGETAKDPEFNRAFNEGMASNSRFGIDTVVRECHSVFEGLESLTDVGGGDGTTARAIAKVFPSIKITVLDLPQVIDTIPAGGVVKYVAGDFFKAVPRAQAALLKYVLHDWSDEDCVKILKCCKAAIAPREAGGKVIIVGVVVGASTEAIFEAELLMDMCMMVILTGKERDEAEWRKIFVDAGFSDYKIVKALGVRCVIEVYP